MNSPAMRAFFWMSVGAVLFAVMNLAARSASQEAHFTMVAATRAFLGLLVAASVGARKSLRITDLRKTRLRSLFGVFAMFFTFFTLSRSELPLSDAATLFNLAPVGVAALSAFWLREPLGKRLPICLALSLVGAVVVLRPAFLFGGSIGGGAGRLIATSSAICAASFASAAMVMLRQVGQKERPEAIAVHFSLAATLVFFVVAIPFAHWPSKHAAIAMLIGGIAAGLGQLALTRAYALERAARVSSMGYLNVVATTGLAAALHGETPSSSTVLGMVLVVVPGIALALASDSGKTASNWR
jgi:drug/metabolite transporter (DMT)-like permease